MTMTFKLGRTGMLIPMLIYGCLAVSQTAGAAQVGPEGQAGEQEAKHPLVWGKGWDECLFLDYENKCRLELKSMVGQINVEGRDPVNLDVGQEIVSYWDDKLSIQERWVLPPKEDDLEEIEKKVIAGSSKRGSGTGHETDVESPLIGRTLRFARRRGSDDAFGLVESGIPSKAIGARILPTSGQWGSRFLAGLFPTAPVAENEVWECPGKNLARDLLLPVGDCFSGTEVEELTFDKLRPGKPDMQTVIAGTVLTAGQLLGSIANVETVATLQKCGYASKIDTHWAAIGLHLKGQGQVDVPSSLLESAKKVMLNINNVGYNQSIAISVEASGQLIWDVDRCIPMEYGISGDLSMVESGHINGTISAPEGSAKQMFSDVQYNWVGAFETHVRFEHRDCETGTTGK